VTGLISYNNGVPLMEIAPDPTNRKLLALDAAVLAISGDLSLADTLARIVKTAADLADAQYAALGVPNDTGEFLAEFITTGIDEADAVRISHRPRGHGILGLVLRDGQTLRLRDLRDHTHSVGFPANHPAMSSFLGVPIARKGRRLGNLYLTNKRSDDEFSAEDQLIIELLAAHAGVAIENARLYEAVQTLSVVEERQRIGMDLHDGVIQSIYAVGLTLEYVKAQLGDGDVSGAADRLDTALDALNGTIRDIRAYILDLRPPRLENDDLSGALQRLLAEFKANTLMQADLRIELGTLDLIDRSATQVLFHVAQEALSNAAKHSRASRVELRLVKDDRYIHLVIRDNGRGFVLEETAQRFGHGLRNMRDRAAALAGHLSIEGRLGEGTEVKLSFPRKD